MGQSSSLCNLSEQGLLQLDMNDVAKRGGRAALDVSHNKLVDLPDGFALQLPNLRSLIATHNHFTTIPSPILGLTQLRRLILASNELESLPDLSGLHNLRSLDVKDNRLRAGAQLQSLQGLQKLTSLSIGRNYIPVETIPVKLRGVCVHAFAQHTPTMILPHLYVGSGYSALCGPELKARSISHIVTVTKSMPPKFPALLKYHLAEIDDEVSEDLTSHLAECVRFIHSGVLYAQQNELGTPAQTRSHDRNEKGSDESGESGTKLVNTAGLVLPQGGVLVHCAAGQSRSVAVVAAYLMCSHGWDVDVALAHIREQRYCIAPNPGFVRQLKQWFDNPRRKTCLQVT